MGVDSDRLDHSPHEGEWNLSLLHELLQDDGEDLHGVHGLLLEAQTIGLDDGLPVPFGRSAGNRAPKNKNILTKSPKYMNKQISLTWLSPVPTPSSLLNTFLTTSGLSLISLGRAALMSCLVRPLRTGIRNLTSATLLAYRSLTLCEIVVKFPLYLFEIPSVPN